MNKILVDQLRTVYKGITINYSGTEITSLILEFPSIKGVLLKIDYRSISVDFESFKTLGFEYVKLFFMDRLRFEDTALYDYKDKNIFNIYFRRSFHSETKDFEDAMWRFGIFKSVVEQISRFSEYLNKNT